MVAERCALVIAGLCVVFGSTVSTASAAKSKWKSKGLVTIEGRLFVPDSDSATVDEGLGLLGRLEASHRYKAFREKARVFGRLDGRDANRTVFIVEELWAEVRQGDFRLRIGADVLNWTATEAFHPADIINAPNLDSDIENYEKLGEPMVRLSYRLGSGTISAFFFPYYTRTILPAQSSRLSFIPPEIEVGSFLRMRANGELTDDDFGPQGALRITQSFRNIDLSLHVVHHMDRLQPEVLFDPEQGRPRPLFRTVTQVGGTYQHVLGAFIAKVEAAFRIFATPDGETTPLGPVQDRDHLQVAFGLEYGFLVQGVEVTLISELQSIFFGDEIKKFFTGQNADTDFNRLRRNLGVFQRDVLFGCRASFNDVNSAQVQATTIVDIDDPREIFVNLSYSQRIGSVWGVSGAVRLAFGPDRGLANQGFSIPADSDHVRLFVTRYF